MKTPANHSALSPDATLHLITAKALQADKKATAAKARARLAKANLKVAKEDFKVAKADLKAAKKVSKRAFKEAKETHEALQVCLDRIAKEKKKAKKHSAVPEQKRRTISTAKPGRSESGAGSVAAKPKSANAPNRATAHNSKAISGTATNSKNDSTAIHN